MSFQPITPARPVPGTYFQTPAPSFGNGALLQNRPLSSAGVRPQSAGSNLAQTTGAKTRAKGKPDTMSPRERGARTIDDALAQDSRYPDLDSYLSRE